MLPAMLFADVNVSIFEPVSPAGTSIRDLAIVVIAVASAILLVVWSVLAYSIVRFRRRPESGPNEPPQVYGSQPIEIAWTAAPALIVFVLVLVVARTEWDVRPKIPEPKTGDNALFVTVVGRQWWWEYRYESYNGAKLSFITANELHVPASDADDAGVKRPVYLKLQSADVCHSYWVPRLGGKVDLVPGRTNWLWLQTSERGLFLGQCAEYCGTQHAKMLLRAYVDEPADFEVWLQNQARDAVVPTEEKIKKGQQAFLKTVCVSCHRVAGTPAEGTYAPDLTHLMSRQTIASGILPNTPENLRDWIMNPQKEKPGCLMNAFPEDGTDVSAIVDYLRTLK